MVTREEFTMLLESVRDNSRRLDSMGTQGLAVQVAEVIKDVADVKTSLESFKKDHVAQHANEERRRVASRRWGWGFAVAALAAVETPLIILIGHIHG